jgi:hypothetical protein
MPQISLHPCSDQGASLPAPWTPARLSLFRIRAGQDLPADSRPSPREGQRSATTGGRRGPNLRIVKNCAKDLLHYRGHGCFSHFCLPFP